jgi:hypothetical protein
MQGSWTVSVKSKNASWAQRYTINGSINSVDGHYNDTSPPVFVTGPQWGITVEHNEPGKGWRQSRHRMKNFRISGGQFLFDIETDDSGGTIDDQDFNDLILTCSMVQSPSEFVIYGTIRTYTGFCTFNPCYPMIYYVVDTARQFRELLKYKASRRIIEKLYPERIREFERKKPFPDPPDPPPFSPLMFPSGLTVKSGYLVERQDSQKSTDDKTRSKKGAPAENIPSAYTMAVETALSSLNLTKEDLLVLGRLKDKYELKPCEVKPVAQTILRFMEYDRSAEELLGTPYTGNGNRSVLGMGATDEFGAFLFRFTQDYAELGEEAGDIGPGEDSSVEMRPDVMIQLIETLPDTVMVEVPPYFNIPNIKHVNICIPLKDIPSPMTCCQGGRAFQAIGNLSIITTGTTLHTDGTVSNTISTGPIVNHAAWYDKLDLFGCFLDTDPAVEYYTLTFRTYGDTGWSEWTPVSERYIHPKKQGDGSWKNELIGPSPVPLRINGLGNPKVTVGAYLNIEDRITHQEWQDWHRDRKIQLNTKTYQDEGGQMEVKIEGYDTSGEKVPGAEDMLLLLIDNTGSKANIESIRLGVDDPGECALFELPVEGQPLTVRYRATHKNGFMKSYTLRVYRGSNTSVPTENAATGVTVDGDYNPIAPFRYKGTIDETIDPDFYVEVSLIPTDGSWLATGVGFCAFSFELSTLDRKTNGYGTPPWSTLYRELVGMTYDWTS